MANLTETLKQHNLSKDRFARLVGVGPLSVMRYERGDETVRDDSRSKIERGLKVLEESGLIFPTWKGKPFDPFWEGERLGKYYKEVVEFEKEFNRLFEADK